MDFEMARLAHVERLPASKYPLPTQTFLVVENPNAIISSISTGMYGSASPIGHLNNQGPFTHIFGLTGNYVYMDGHCGSINSPTDQGLGWFDSPPHRASWDEWVGGFFYDGVWPY